MSGLQQVLYERLTSNEELNGLLVGGISSEWFASTAYPRMLFRLSRSRIDTEIGSGTLVMDVFSDENNQVKMDRILVLVQSLLENVYLTTDETGPTLRMFFVSAGYIADPDPQVLHLSINYALRGARIKPALLV